MYKFVSPNAYLKLLRVSKTAYSTKDDKAQKLNSLLQSIIQNDSTKSLKLAQPKARKPKSQEQSGENEQSVLQAAQKVGDMFGAKSKEVQTELISKLLETNKSKDALLINKLITNMKVENVASSRQKKFQLPKSEARSQPSNTKLERVNLNSEEGLNIFTGDFTGTQVRLPTWEKLEQRELRLAVTHPPRNHFEQMALWTEQGKLWKFPIDNEQGMDSEKDVYFADHVFLEPLLDDWCPKQGPIRHFMELVCVGLSKNHYLSVQDKRNHIAWFKDYFVPKEKLLKEIGAIPENYKMS